MRGPEPLRPLIVEVDDRAAAKFANESGSRRDGALGIGGFGFVHPVDPVRRIQPPVAEFCSAAVLAMARESLV